MRALIATVALVSLSGCVTYPEPHNAVLTSVENDGNRLKYVCTNPSLSFGCASYIGGVVDGAALQAKITDEALPYCGPGRLKYGQYVDVVTQYLNDHSEHLHQHASLLIMFALRDVFPCKG